MAVEKGCGERGQPHVQENELDKPCGASGSLLRYLLYALHTGMVGAMPGPGKGKNDRRTDMGNPRECAPAACENEGRMSLSRVRQPAI